MKLVYLFLFFGLNMILVGCASKKLASVTMSAPTVSAYSVVSSVPTEKIIVETFYPKEIEELMAKLSNCITAVGIGEHPHLIGAEKLADLDAHKKLSEFYGVKVESNSQIVMKSVNDEVSNSYFAHSEQSANNYVKNATTIKTLHKKTTDGYTAYVLKIIAPNATAAKELEQFIKENDK